jgi:hypothetical protein
MSDIQLTPVGGSLGATLGLPEDWYYEYAEKVSVLIKEYLEVQLVEEAVD